MQLAQGGISPTGGDLDVAIEGQGLSGDRHDAFAGQAAYTRDGALKRTGDGLLVTSDGHPVIPDITIPDDARSISINPEGEVYASFDWTGSNPNCWAS